MKSARCIFNLNNKHEIYNPIQVPNTHIHIKYQTIIIVHFKLSNKLTILYPDISDIVFICK